MFTLYTTLPVAFACVLASVPLRSLTHAGQTSGATSPLAGIWKVSLKDVDGVALDFRMTFAVTSPGEPLRWEAYSRQGAARDLVSGGIATLGRLTGRMPPKEALVYVGDGTAQREGDNLRLTGALDSPFLGQRAFAGLLTGDRIQAELRRGAAGVKAGTMEAIRDQSSTPFRDYPAIAKELEGAIRERIFDPALLSRREFQRFFQDLPARFARAQDDLDAVGAFQALIRSLGTSHFEFIRNPKVAAYRLEDIVLGDPTVNTDTYVRLTFPAPQVAFLRITKWDRVTAPVDRAFQRIESVGAQVLILDVRNNSGGDATSMSPLAHLIREPVIIGTFLARKWYDSHRAAPTAAELSQLPALSSDSSFSELMKGLREHGAITGRALPRPPFFGGTVYLLTDGGTASASEPLAHTLKTLRRATIIGERTAGAMLTALPQPLREGWVATIPQADFVAADGTRLEGKGVEPTIKTPSNDVFFAVADQIASALPFSAVVIRAGSFEALKRADEAERAYREALRLVDRQTPAPPPASRATVHKRLAALLTAKGDREGALREYSEVLKLVPDDAEALAALKARGQENLENCFSATSILLVS